MTLHFELDVFAQGERELVMTRGFAAPRRLVFDALTKPELLMRWLGVRGGWILAECEIDLRVGGLYRYLWRNEAKKIDMGAGGEFLEVSAPERLGCTEKFDDAWYAGEARITTTLEEADGNTAMTVTILYESLEARDSVLHSPMKSGVAASYDLLEKQLAAGWSE